jgi:multiple sugar transport system permease protein
MASVAGARRRKRRYSLQAREAFDAYIGLLPFLVGFVVFTAGPILYSFYLSFTKYEVLSPPRWIGLENYISMIKTDELFPQSLWITTKYTLVAVPAGVVVGYILALILNRKVVGLSFWRTAFYIPSVVPTMATAYIWSWLLQSDVGIVNQLLRSIGLPAPAWWGDPTWVLWAFILMGLWGAGGGVVLYLSALQGVPTALYDAAKVDGANAWQRFWTVTAPLTSPVIFFTFLTGMIGSFQIFTAGFVTTNGGPGNASLFYVLYLFRNGWEYLKMGYAAAMAWILFVVLVVLTWLSLRLSGRLVYYETGE